MTEECCDDKSRQNEGGVRNGVCPRCHTQPGCLHFPGCSVEQCPYCGHQLLSCCCDGLGIGEVPADDRLPWTGRWPGEVECEEFGWFAEAVPGGWKPVDGKPGPKAIPDLNRLRAEARWDRKHKRFVRKAK